jgi:hypothetical protein
VKVTATLAPASAVRVSTPAIWVASALVAPLATPVPKVKLGAEGAAVSMLKLMVLALALGLPAASVALALALTLP